MAEEKKVENFLMKVWLETVENTVGLNGLKSVLNYAHLEKYIDNYPEDDGNFDVPGKDAQALFLSLSELFGQKGARSLLLRAGSEFARLGIEGRSRIAKALQIATRLVPESTKIRLLLERISDQYARMYTFGEMKGDPAEVKPERDHYLLVFRDYFESEGITSQTPVCSINTGMLQYLVKWITGHEHKVKEVQCRAMGDPADVFSVEITRKKDV